MNTPSFVPASGDVRINPRVTLASAAHGRSGTELAALTAARARLASAAQRRLRERPLSNNGYYGTTRTRLEEILHDIPNAHCFDAIVTRNHYGSLVLNAAHALFIDVDMLQPRRAIPPINVRRERWLGPWRRTLDDLRTVLTSEHELGFRIYRTAAGFRILATTREFEPGSEPSQRLMNVVGADAAFVDLCHVQQTFRARLTPKPWRCGTGQPPNAWPRESAEDRRCFTNWLAQYERACRDRATCQYLEHVGPADVHGRIAPIMEVHDRATKAFQSLPLA